MTSTFSQAVQTAAETARNAGTYAYIHETDGAFFIVLTMPLTAPVFHAVCPRSGEVSQHSAF